MKEKIIELLTKNSANFTLQRVREKDNTFTYLFHFKETPYEIFHFFDMIAGGMDKWYDDKSNVAYFECYFDDMNIYADCCNIDFNGKENI